MYTHIDDDVLRRAITCILGGGVIAYPTDTVYGLGGDASRDHATERIRQLKGSDPVKPLLVLTDTWDRVEHWIGPQDGFAVKLMAIANSYPITILFGARKAVPQSLIGGESEVGIRLCHHPFCIRLIKESGRLISSTSANVAGKPTPRELADIDEVITSGVDLAIDGGRLSGQPSTIVRPEKGRVDVLREGSVSVELLKRLLA